MRNKRFILSLLILLFGAAACVYAQSGKKEEIRVPRAALQPRLSLDDVNKRLDEFFKWLDDVKLPATGKTFDQNYNTSPATLGVVRQKLMNFRALVLDPDLEEVTKLPRSWYVEMYDASLPLLKASDIFLNVHLLCIEANYQKGRQMWNTTVDEVFAIRKAVPRELTKDALDGIAQKNQARRKKEYIRLYKIQQAAALKKAREEAAAAASGQTKNSAAASSGQTKNSADASSGQPKKKSKKKPKNNKETSAE